jgi:hypothetical protein
MEIRLRSNGQVMYEGEFRQLNPNTSFPQQISADTLNDFGADVVLEGPQASPTRYQTAFRDGVQEIDGKWYTKYSVADIDDETKTAKDAEQAKYVRTTRNEKLKDSDWTQVADAPVDKTVWATYRQALRDVTAQSGFPWEITWPTQP